jgi:hypothetical protein
MAIAAEANALFGQAGVGIHPATLADIHGCLVNHGIAFATIETAPREDGTRVDMGLRFWPIEYIRWDPVFRVFKARANPETVQPGDLHTGEFDSSGNVVNYGFVGGFWIPVVHGDGRWVIFSKNESLPFRSVDACILAAATVWARHAFAIRDWTKGSVAHGSAKVVGELPQGVPLQDAEGALTQDASALAQLLRAFASSDQPVGIRPAGSKTEFITNNSTAWQVWSELVSNAEKAAARIYLGTDGILGTQGGAPGVDITALFGVASTIVRGDLECIERGINTGLIEPWCAINFGDSNLAPRRQRCLLDEDAESEKKAYADRMTAYSTALKTLHDAGVVVTESCAAEMAVKYGVQPLQLAAPIAPPPPKPGSGEGSVPAAAAAPTSNLRSVPRDVKER